MKKNIPQRVVVQIKDIQNLTGKSRQYAGQVLIVIKTLLGKSRHQYITVTEFCEFTGIKPEDMMDAMQN